VCTLTWLHHGQGYELFFNRDEKRTRAPARPPQVRERAGRRWIAPSDPDGGGTWIGANEFGLCVALLNGYLPRDAEERAWVTRGELVDGLLDARTQEEVRVRLSKRHLERYRSFSIVAVAPTGPALVASWDLNALVVDARHAGHPPICSSSLDPTGATVARRELFARLAAQRGTIDAELLERFHRSHEPERGPWSPCMHRDNAQTQSLTHVRVTEARVALHYTHGAPCEGATQVAFELPRVVVS
jgi:hypothetical protein